MKTAMRHYARTLATALAALALTACATGVREKADTRVMASEEGDSTIYALACDGCNDTILIYLSDVTADPDTLNILAASRSHKVLGTLEVGSLLAILRNAKDTTKADLVVSLENLTGQWCYLATPTLRKRADQTDREQQEMLRAMPDSMRTALFQPIEYGFKLKGDNTAMPVGANHEPQDQMSIVVYPEPKRYREWKLMNGRLILTEMALDSTSTLQVTGRDTAEIMLLKQDSLVLHFADGEQRHYYRKSEE